MSKYFEELGGHKRFDKLLLKHNVNVNYDKLIHQQLKATFSQMNASTEENQSATKAKIADLSHKIERLEERYMLEEITGELYQKYKLKFETEREGIEVEIKKNKIEMSKLDDYISFTLNLSINLSKMRTSSDYTGRQELQNSFFPQGITYNRQKDECRSIEVNEFLEEASDLSGAFATFTPEQTVSRKSWGAS